MARHERIKRERLEDREADSHHKKKKQQQEYDQLKTSDEAVTDSLSEPSIEWHAALLADTRSDEQMVRLVTHLQQSYGNAYVQRLLSSRIVQAKLTVNLPDDVYEREADRVAEMVTQGPASQIQRQEELPEEEIQAKASRIQRQAEEEEEIQAKASQIQRQEEDGEIQAKPPVASATPLVQHNKVPNVVQRGIWEKISGIFGRKTRPEDVEIKKAEKRANVLTKKHRKIVKKMEKLNDQHLRALEKGKFDKADVIFTKFEELSKEHDEVRDEADEAVTHYSQLVMEEGEKISELLSQPLEKPTESQLKEADMELDKLSKETEERKSTLSEEENEFQRILDSIEVTQEELEAYKAKPGVKEEDEFQRILDSIEVTQDELKAYIEKLKAKEEEETERQLGEVKIPTTKLPEAKPGAKEEEEEKKAIMAKPASEIQRQPLAVAEDLEAQINAARGSGQPLSDSVRASLEPQFERDFSDVRVHTDTEADGLSQQLEAKAFTTGKDIFFREGAYQPESEDGKKLIAHEVTHVVQQEAAPALQRQAAEAPAEAAAVKRGFDAATADRMREQIMTPIEQAVNEGLTAKPPDIRKALDFIAEGTLVVAQTRFEAGGFDEDTAARMRNAILTPLEQAGEILSISIGAPEKATDLLAKAIVETSSLSLEATAG